MIGYIRKKNKENEQKTFRDVAESLFATNGDVLMTLFPTFKTSEINSDTVVLEQIYPLPTCVMQFDRKWWNTPYKETRTIMKPKWICRMWTKVECGLKPQ